MDYDHNNILKKNVIHWDKERDHLRRPPLEHLMEAVRLFKLSWQIKVDIFWCAVRTDCKIESQNIADSFIKVQRVHVLFFEDISAGF